MQVEQSKGAGESISTEKAPGLSGWTRQLLDIATREAAVIKCLQLLTNMIRQGTAPGPDLLCASRLIGLAKPDGGIRPIAIGDMIYRVAMKAILTAGWRSDMLLPCQLGVSSPGGVEPAIYLLDEAIIGPPAGNEADGLLDRANYNYLASLDLANAFNSTARATIAASVARYAPVFYKAAAWAYNSPSILAVRNGPILASSEGIRQGDPLGPLLFSLAARPTIEQLQRTLPTAKIIAYLAYAAFHCSSLLAFALSNSSCETKRDRTEAPGSSASRSSMVSSKLESTQCFVALDVPYESSARWLSWGCGKCEATGIEMDNHVEFCFQRQLYY